MRIRRFATLVLLFAILAGCVSTSQLTSNTETMDFCLDAAAFHESGLGFLTPVSATGQEADRVALALAFADAVDAARNDLEVVRLAEVLSAVNRDGLANEYKQMVDDYAATGIMEKHTLRKVGGASNARFLGLLSLGGFSQHSNKRFSVGGMRVFDTKQASIRLSLQIWDSNTGEIAWEGSDEIHYAYDTGRERPVNLSFVAARAATNLMAEIPAIDPSKPMAVAAVTAE